MMPSPDETFLRERARQAIRNRRLPRTRPDRRFGGPGEGSPCPVCGEPIGQHQMAMEIEFNRDGATPGLDHYLLHVRCFTAWEFERNWIEGTSA
jgi:hypothetical protein